MKILRITLKNLNSLHGDHDIDLSCEPLSSTGLFAITGPTGSGKSTLLDAITLALYGRSARYGSQPSPEDMMSRHCGECAAEVTFSVPSGTYRSVWQLRKARGKADGKIQTASRFVYDAGGAVLAQKVREADDMIEKLVGLDYERFLRSVMLAQGEFARFLKANANDRADLLESLTGTIIYSELSQLAYREATRRENELDEQEKQLGQIHILEDAQRSEIEGKITSATEEKQDLSAKIEQNAEMVQNINALAEALQQKQKFLMDHEALQAEINGVQTDLELLIRHHLTLPYSDDLVRLDIAEETLKNASKKRKTAEKTCRSAADARTQATAIYRAVLKYGIEEQQVRIAKALANAELSREKAQKTEKWLHEHQKDASLSEHITDLATSITELKAIRGSLADSRDALYKTTAILAEIQQDFPESFEALSGEELEGILDNIGRRLEKEGITAKAQHKLAEKDLKLRRDHLEKSRLIASLEDHRSTLVDGAPCPLCGATKHPYVADQEPCIAFEELEEAVTRAEHTLNTRAELVGDIEDAIEGLAERKPVTLERMGEWHTLKQTLSATLNAFGETLPEPEKENELRKALQKQAKTYEKHKTEREEALQIRENADEEQTEAQACIAEWTPYLKSLGEASSEEDEIALDEALPTLPQARDAWSEAKANLNTRTSDLQSRLDDETMAREEREKIRGKITTALKTSAFKDIEALCAARLEQGEVDRITRIKNDLKDREHELKTRQSDMEKQIAQLRQTNVPEGEAAAQFKAQQVELQNKRDALIQSLTTWQNQLAEDAQNQKKRADQLKALEEARRELGIWVRLREMIGSHDGAKFKKYAQSISLDILVRNANKHLSRLSDRYRIRRTGGAELQLEIEDMYQASVTRPMASLSGGESFLTSLALALGLSELAGRNVRIESLFIDEGFGSLDSETLDLAIGTLESLQQDNKCIGVISHVELLKQRITTQIMVEKQPAGISTLKIVY